MKRIFVVGLVLLASLKCFAQEHLDQNGWKTSVTNPLFANELQAMRYEIAILGYNSFHWQPGGLIIIELFHRNFSTGYEKYIVENGYGQGANHGSPSVKLVESHGAYHLAKITLGNGYDLSSSHGGYVNKALQIYLDVRHYAGYKVKLTYLHDRVESLDHMNQIKVNTNPSGSPIPDFEVSDLLDNHLASAGNLMVAGTGNHYIKNGNVGIGTTAPAEKLSVNGKIRAHEIKVETANWPDYVFAQSYQLPTLQETEKHIKEKGHLPGIPSAADVKANGIDVGEMNAKLLQKIEELTLHLIEMNKKMDVMQQENQLIKAKLINKDQEERLEKLETRIKTNN